MKKNKKQDFSRVVLTMDSDLYRVRRLVIDALYDARRVLGADLPRVKVRIVSFEDGKLLGMAFLGKNDICISRGCEGWSADRVRSVVWHELAHAWFGAEHTEGCPLMGAVDNGKYDRAAEERVLRTLAGDSFKKKGK